MYQDLLDKIAKDKLAYSEYMQPPATSEELSNLCEKAFLNFKTKLPMEYTDFLKLTNGLDWNGLTIFASETSVIVNHPDRYIKGVIEANQMYRQSEDSQNIIILGNSGIDVYIYCLDRNVYHIAERISLRVISTFSSFNEMLSQVLKTLL